MRLDYGAILCPEPLTLSIGTIKKPTLREIGRLTFDKFGYYEFLMRLTPELFFAEMCGDDGASQWEALTDDEKGEINLYDILSESDALAEAYREMFDFFFIEPVIFKEGFFIILNKDIENEEDVSAEDIQGVISGETFQQVLNILQQICCVYEEKQDPEELRFKNKLAKQLYEKMQKAKRAENKNKKADINFSLPNIVSAVSNKHPTISPITVWDLTVFQLLDAFNRMQANTIYDIDSTRVSVWGDEKKVFDVSLWYKNEYEKNQNQSDD